MRARLCRFAIALLVSAMLVAQQQPVSTPFGAPPMGWNSWDSYGLTISEAEFRANAAVLRDTLKPFGWQYAVIDEGWYMQNPLDRPHPERLRFAIDANGRFLPAPERFPSSGVKRAPRSDGQVLIYANSAGLAALGKWTHAQGLKFGIHIIRGIPKESVRLNLPIADSKFRVQDAADTADTCPWDPTSYGVRDNAAGQAWYDALVRQYAGWGVDFLKVDCISDHPYRATEIRQLHDAIAKTHRPMLLSLSPGPTNLSHAEEVARNAQMWRISDDVWDEWQNRGGGFPASVKSQFARLAAWAPLARPGGFPDADMLPLGELRPKPDVGPGPRASRLTANEQRTQMNLWCISRSPLILGANLTLLDAKTRALLTNRDVLRVNQTALASREALKDGSLIVWTADLPRGERAVAFFNVGDTELPMDAAMDRIGLKSEAVEARDAWTGETHEVRGKFKLTIAPHASALYLVRDR